MAAINYVMTPAEIDSILRIDSGLLCSKSGAKKFIISNRGQYILVVNTWLLLAQEYTRFGATYLKQRILRDGLYRTIEDAQAQSMLLVHDEGMSDLWQGIYVELQTLTDRQQYSSREINNSDPRTIMLWILRYPKRFSVVNSDLLQQKTVKAFRDRERENKFLDRNRFEHRYLIRMVKEEIRSMLPWKKLCKELSKVVKDDWAFRLTPGACAGGIKTPEAKLQHIFSTIPEAIYPIMGRTNVYVDIIQGRDWSEACLPSTLMAVPKSYKAYRMIAPEPPARAAKARALMDVLTRYLPSHFPWQNQDEMKDKARVGSITGEYATTDSTAASDSITRFLFRECFPAEYVSLVDSFLPILIDLGDTDEWGYRIHRTLYSATTSGNPLTFFHEGIFFLAVANCAKKYTALFNPTSQRDPWAYGDDLISSPESYDLLHEMLEILGIHVNQDKSFSTPYNFRESCGGDFYKGMDVSSLYWPRRALEGRTPKDIYTAGYVHRDSLTNEEYTGVSILLALVRRLYHAAPGAAHFIADTLIDAGIGLTRSVAGSDNNDLWGYESTSKKVNSPYAIFKDWQVKPYFPVHRELVKIKVDQEPESFGYGPKIAREHPKRTPLMQHYIYMLYLKDGPFYATEQDRLLGLSTSRWLALTSKATATLGTFPKLPDD